MGAVVHGTASDRCPGWAAMFGVRAGAGCRQGEACKPAMAGAAARIAGPVVSPESNAVLSSRAQRIHWLRTLTATVEEPEAREPQRE